MIVVLLHILLQLLHKWRDILCMKLCCETNQVYKQRAARWWMDEAEWKITEFLQKYLSFCIALQICKVICIMKHHPGKPMKGIESIHCAVSSLACNEGGCGGGEHKTLFVFPMLSTDWFRNICTLQQRTTASGRDFHSNIDMGTQLPF